MLWLKTGQLELLQSRMQMAYNPLRRSFTKWIDFKYPVMLGLNTTAPKDLTGYQSPDLSNVRHIISGQLESGEAIPAIRTRTGFGLYSHGRTAGLTAQIKGGYGYIYKNSSNVLTYRNIVQANDGKYYSVPLSSTILDEDRFSKADNTSSLGSTAGGKAWSATATDNSATTWGISGSLPYMSLGATIDPTFSAVFDSGVSDGVLSALLSVNGATTENIGIVFRYSDYRNFWFAYMQRSGTNKMVLQKWVNGSASGSQSGTLTFAAGDIIEVKLSGNDITVYQNGTSVIGPTTDAFNATETKHGLGYYHSSSVNTARLSDFRVQSITPEWVALNSALSTTATDYPSFETFNNFMVVSNGSDNMKQWDGTESATALVDVVASGWVTKTPIPRAEQDNASFVIGNNGYVSGDGYFYIYDAISDTWRAGVQSISLQACAFAGVIGGIGYLALGETASVDLQKTESYDPSNQTWVVKTAGGTARRRGNSAVIQNKLYTMAGGTFVLPSTTATSKKTDYYEPYSDTWTNVADSPVEKRYSMDNSENGGCGQIAFGEAVVNTAVKTNYWYSVNAWSTLTAGAAEQTTMNCSVNEGTSYWKGGAADASTGVLYSFNRAANSWSTLTDEGTHTNNGTFFNVYGKLYYVGGYNGTVAVATNYCYNANVQPPKAMYLKNHKGHLFGARTPTHQNRVWFSSTGDHSIWDPDSFMDINKDDGGWLTGIETFANGNFLIAFKSSGLYAIDGTVFDPDPTIGNFSIRMINDKGCIAPKSIAKVNDNLLIYFGTDGKFYEFDGVNSKAISEPIIATTNSYDGSRYQYAKAVFFPKYNEYWCTMRTTTSSDGHDVVLVYNVITKQWFRFSPANLIDSLWIVKDSATTLPVLLGGSFAKGSIYRFDTDKWATAYTADEETTAISSYYITAWTGLGNNLWKLIRRMYAYCTQPLTGSLLLDVYSNFSGNASQTQQSNAMTHTDQRNRFDLSSTGHRFQFKFSNSTLNQFFEIQSFDIYWKPKGGGLFGQTL